MALFPITTKQDARLFAISLALEHKNNNETIEEAIKKAKKIEKYILSNIASKSEENSPKKHLFFF